MAEEVTVVREPARYTLEQVAALARDALEAVGAERAVVFGSWARGTADGFSDLDLVVVLETALPALERGRLLKEPVEALPLGVDLLVYTPAEYARGIDSGLGVFEAIAREGVTIHARGEG